VTVTWDALSIVQLCIAFVLPLLVGLVTKTSMRGGVKALLLAGLNLVLALLSELARALTAGETFDLGVALISALPAFIVSVGAHMGLWKPTGVTNTVQHLLVTDKDTTPQAPPTSPTV
jgi:hypothetical protein